MKTESCTDHSIADFLADRLTDQQQAAFEQHLDSCDSCCAALQLHTADASLWNEAQTFLSSADHLRLPNATMNDPAITNNGRGSQPDTRLNLEFLAPTDDPHMLGRFASHEISGVIGCGGMGIVLKGFDASLNRYAAIKVLSPHFATNGAARQRFEREAQAAAAVVHDNVIAIHGVSEFNSLPYLLMPYVKGQSLQKRIDQHGPLAVTERLDALPPVDWSTEQLRLLRSIGELIHYQSTGEKRDFNKIASRLTQFATADVSLPTTGDKDEVRKAAHSSLILGELVRLTGHLQDKVLTCEPTDADIAAKLKRLKTLKANIATVAPGVPVMATATSPETSAVAP